ncbi:CXXC motif containing zinc binding protein-like [Ochotona princeps]|uniref:CXXC motif containing zinc binding protein-like n=1 Tax=Ochotona princeps TaxID=9978 RepID=UPI002714F538|nr:CXXC motif containing zinc binding protein-like [Ochotona princeps]
MVVILLKMKATLENVKSIEIPPDHTWVLDVKHPAGEEVRERVTLSAAEVQSIPNSRGSANFLVRWEGSKQVSTINIQQLKNVTRLMYDANDRGKFVPIVAFECRGVEPIQWYPATGYTVKSAKATFTDVDLSEDWADYDQEANEPVGIYEVEYEFQTYK